MLKNQALTGVFSDGLYLLESSRRLTTVLAGALRGLRSEFQLFARLGEFTRTRLCQPCQGADGAQSQDAAVPLSLCWLLGVGEWPRCRCSKSGPKNGAALHGTRHHAFHRRSTGCPGTPGRRGSPPLPLRPRSESRTVWPALLRCQPGRASGPHCGRAGNRVNRLQEIVRLETIKTMNIASRMTKASIAT